MPLALMASICGPVKDPWLILRWLQCDIQVDHRALSWPRFVKKGNIMTEVD